MTDVVISSAAGTAIGSYGRSLEDVPPTELGAIAAREALRRARAEELGAPVRARIAAYAACGVEPEYMGIGPVAAVRKALDRAGRSLDPNGGAVALGGGGQGIALLLEAA